MRPPTHQHATADGVPDPLPLPDGTAPPATGPAYALLREENAQLKHALERRPVIDMARGVLMATFRCTSEDAWRVLVTVSQHANTKVRVVAEAVIATTEGEPMPEHLRAHLAAALDRSHEW